MLCEPALVPADVSPTPVAELGARAKVASRVVSVASTAQKDDALAAAADRLDSHVDAVLAANAADVASAEEAGTPAPLVDRLRLTPARVEAMAGGLRQVAALPDPVGAIVDGWTRPNGLRIQRVRVPLGVVAIIYESRPNVTSDAFGICLKSGNVAFLRGSSAALRSNVAVAEALHEGVAKAGLPPDSLVLVTDTSHRTAAEFMKLREHIDCLIPRGGPALIRSVLEHATVPYVIDGDGNCHVYVDASADLAMARDIVVNAKVSRPSVCNAAESLVVHADVARDFIPVVAEALHGAGVELVGDTRSASLTAHIGRATDEDFSTEFLELKMSVAVVDTLSEAIAHVNTHGSGHSEAIVTNDLAASERFCAEVDAAATLVNASTRFVDGEEFGFGAEIGISTQKLHARGPMGLEQLTTLKFVVHGDGQVR